MHSFSLFVALRYSRSRQGSRFLNFITFFSMAGIALGVAALIIVLSVMNGFEDQLKQRILGAVPHLLIEQSLSEQQWQGVITELAVDKRINKITMVNLSEAMIQGPNQLQAVMLQGIDPEQESSASIIAKHMYTGQFLGLKAGEYRIILGTRLASNLGVYVGDKVKLLSAKRSIYTPLGRMPSQRNFTVVGLFELSSEIDGNLALIHRVDAAKLLRQQSNNVPALRLYLNDAFSATDVATAIMPTLNKTLGPDVKITSWHQRYGQLFTAVKMEKKMMWLMLSLIIGVAAFNIVSALVILVTEKQTAIAIFATLGLPQSAIAKIFIIQGVINGVLGTIIGLVIGLGLTLFLNDLLSIFGITALANPVDPANGLPILVKPLQIFYLLVATVVVTFLATLYPSYKAGKVNPAEALKHE